jgi:hypothetical protein
MEAVMQRLIELLHHQKNRLEYRKRIVQGLFAQGCTCEQVLEVIMPA